MMRDRNLRLQRYTWLVYWLPYDSRESKITNVARTWKIDHCRAWNFLYRDKWTPPPPWKLDLVLQSLPNVIDDGGTSIIQHQRGYIAWRFNSISGQAVIVGITMYVLSISSLSEVQMVTGILCYSTLIHNIFGKMLKRSDQTKAKQWLINCNRVKIITT